MALPKKLKLMNTFINGDNYLGRIPSVTLPKFTQKTEDYQGGGMIAAVAVKLGFEPGALDMQLNTGGLEEALIAMLGTATADGNQFRFTGSYQAEDSEAPIPVELQTRGRIVEIDQGEATQGEDTKHTHTVKNTYAKLTVNGKDLLEVDALNLIFKVNGTDVLEKHRANLGL